MFVGFNLLHVLVAALAALVVGFVWYLPPVLGKRWASFVNRYAGVAEQELLTPKNPLRDIALWLITTIVNAFVLAFLIRTAGTNNLAGAIVLAIAVWAGFGLTFSSWPVIFAGQPVGLWLINNGAYLLMQIIMSIILTLWS